MIFCFGRVKKRIEILNPEYPSTIKLIDFDQRESNKSYAFLVTNDTALYISATEDKLDWVRVGYGV
jgi:tRNA-binding EMAP/Myf-like protein